MSGDGGPGPLASPVQPVCELQISRSIKARNLALDMPDEIADGFDLSFQNFNASELIFDQYH